MKTLNCRARRFAGAVCIANTFYFLNITPASSQEAKPTEDPHEIDEIVVSASALERTGKQLAQPTAVLDGDELATKQSTSIGETLSHELGVSSSYFGPVASRPVIRGQYGERVRVLSNSLDAMDASALSEDHAVSVDSLLAEQIEIVRGPATLLYGSGAAGGLVNVVDERILESPLEESSRGAASLGTDSATGKVSGAAKIAFGGPTVAAHLDYFRLDTDNVRIPGFAESAILRASEEAEEGPGEEEEHEEAYGSVENTDSTSEGGAGALSFTGENGFFGLSYSVYDSNYGIPGHSHEHEEGEEEEGEEEAVRIDLEQTRVDLKGEYRFDGPFNRVRVRMARNDYQHTELEGSEIGTVFDTRGTDARVELGHGGDGAFEGALGMQYKKIDFDAVGEEAFVPPSDTVQTSLFAFEEWAISDAWVLQGSARIEWQTVESPLQAENDDSAFGASIGAIWSFAENFSLSANLVHSERHPNSTELYASGPHLAVGRVERGSVTLGNGFLDKELSTNLDVTLRGGNERFEFALTGFINAVDDYIFLSASGDTEDDLPVFDYGQDDVDIVGMEAEMRIELFDTNAGHMHMQLFGDFVHAEVRDSGEYLPRIPPLRYGVGFHYARERLGALVELIINDEQDKTAPNELPTEGYQMLNAEVTYAFDSPNLFVFARGTNLLDEDARQHTSPLKDIVPLPARSLQLGIRFDF
ncbi:MAG: TonB-dependent receptor [Woeseiaceae bacterium]